MAALPAPAPRPARLLGHDNFDFVVLNQGGPMFEGQCVLESARCGVPCSNVDFDADDPVVTERSAEHSKEEKEPKR